MSLTPPQITVPYVSPYARSLSTAQRAALAGLISTVLTAILTGALKLVQGGSFTQAALQAAAVATLTAIISSLIVFLQKFSETNAASTLVTGATVTVPVTKSEAVVITEPAVPPASGLHP